MKKTRKSRTRTVLLSPLELKMRDCWNRIVKKYPVGDMVPAQIFRIGFIRGYNTAKRRSR